MKEKGLSIRKACGLLNLNTSTYFYEARKPNDSEFIEVIKAIAGRFNRWGYRRITDRMNFVGIDINHKKVYRLYRDEGLQVRKRKRRKTALRTERKAELPTRPNQRWSMDFMSDTTEFSGKFRVFNVIDDFVRDCLAAEASKSITGKTVTAYLDRILAVYGKPESILTDNGPEFISMELERWCRRNGVEHYFIAPGKPTQNAFIESFNGSMRDECLNSNWFMNIESARESLENFRFEYNEIRPHSSIGGIPPSVFRERLSGAAPPGGQVVDEEVRILAEAKTLTDSH